MTLPSPQTLSEMYPSMAVASAPVPESTPPSADKLQALYPTMKPSAPPKESRDLAALARYPSMQTDADRAAIATVEQSAPRAPAAAAAADVQISLPKGFEVDAVAMGEFKAVAKANGLTSETASKLVAWDMQRNAKQDQAWAAELAKEPKETVTAAVEAFIDLAGDDADALAEDIRRAGLANNPRLMRLLARARG